MSPLILPRSLHNSKQYFQQKAFKNTDVSQEWIKIMRKYFHYSQFSPCNNLQIFPKMGWIYFQFTFINHTISQILQVFDTIFDGLDRIIILFDWKSNLFVFCMKMPSLFMFSSKARSPFLTQKFKEKIFSNAITCVRKFSQVQKRTFWI